MLSKPPFAESKLGESIAIAASKFGVRPSEMLGIESNTAALLYDLISAIVLFEAEAAAHGSTGGPSAPPLGRDKLKIINERIKRQEQEAKEQAERLG